MCGGFTCSKNSLIGLNIIYVVVAVMLIIVAAYAKFVSIVTAISVVSGIIACGTFLLIISIIGILAAAKHHQVLLFFYMIILFVIFILQFSIACACLAINVDQQNALAKQGWQFSANSSEGIVQDAQVHFHCCGYKGVPENTTCNKVTNSNGQNCCPDSSPNCCSDLNLGACMCSACNEPLQESIGKWLSIVGGTGLFFSFTEVVGFLIAKRYRHQIDPRANIQSLLGRN